MNENTNNPSNQYFIPPRVDEDYKWNLAIEVIKDKSAPIKVIRNLWHIVVTKAYVPELVKSTTVVRLIDHSADSKEGQEEQRFQINDVVYRDGTTLNSKQKKEINESLPNLANSPVDNSYEIIELSLESKWTDIKESIENHVTKMYRKKPEIELISVETTLTGFLYKPYWYVELVNGSQTYNYILDGDFDGNFLQNAEQTKHPFWQILEMFGKIMEGLGNKVSSGNENNTIQDFVNKEIDSIINADRLDHKLATPVTWIAVTFVIDVLASICLGVIDYLGWLILVNVVAWTIILLLYRKCMRMFTNEDIPTRVKAAQKLFGKSWENIDTVIQVKGH